MPKVTKTERNRRDGILEDLGAGDYEQGRQLFRRLAAEQGLGLHETFDAYSPAANLLAVYDVALDFSRSTFDAPSGSTDLFVEHMPSYNQNIVQDIAEEVERAGLSWCRLDLDPFPIWTTPQWYERVRGYGMVLSSAFRFAIPKVVEAKFGELQILLIRRGRTMYAWVGTGGYGFADKFHLDEPLPEFGRGLRTGSSIGNVRRLVLGCAFAWSVDLRIHGESAPPGLLNMAIGDAQRDSPVYEAADAYRNQVAETRISGSQLIAAHWRCAHLRAGNASQAKIDSAPNHFRRHVGHGWTWVEGHQVSDQVALTIQRLMSRTSIADAVGMAYQKRPAR